MLNNQINVAWAKFIEKIDFDVYLLKKMNLQQSTKCQVCDSRTSSMESTNSTYQNNRPSKHISKKNLLYLNSNFINLDDKITVPNIITLRKRKKPEFNNINQMVEEMERCSIILQTLMNHKYGWVFNEPVDAMKLGIPGYHSIIKCPMDLGTISKNLQINYYLNKEEFAYDVRLTFLNAMTYNSLDHDVYKMAQALSKLFEQQWNKKVIKCQILKRPKLNIFSLLRTKVNTYYNFIHFIKLVCRLSSSSNATFFLMNHSCFVR